MTTPTANPARTCRKMLDAIAMTEILRAFSGNMRRGSGDPLADLLDADDDDGTATDSGEFGGDPTAPTE